LTAISRQCEIAAGANALSFLFMDVLRDQKSDLPLRDTAEFGAKNEG